MERLGKITAVKIKLGRDNRITVKLPYNKELIDKIKTLEGRRSNPEKKYWEIPYKEGLISRIQTLLGEIIIEPYFYLLPLEKELSIRKYSKKTINSYLRYNRELLVFF